MKYTYKASGSARTRDNKFEEFYDDFSHDWQKRAKKLQMRRWRELKRAMREGHYIAH